MNAYTTKGQARIQPRDFSAVLRANRFMAGASLAGLERQRACQAEVEVDWLLKQHGVTPQANALLVSRLRQAIGTALIRAGDRLADVPHSAVSRESASASTGT